MGRCSSPAFLYVCHTLCGPPDPLCAGWLCFSCSVFLHKAEQLRGRLILSLTWLEGEVSGKEGCKIAFTARWRGGGRWAQEAQAAVQQLQEALAPLEAHLAPRTFVAGQALSLADLVLAADLRPAFQQASPAPRPSGNDATNTCPTRVTAD